MSLSQAEREAVTRLLESGVTRSADALGKLSRTRWGIVSSSINEVPVVRLLSWFQRSPDRHLAAHLRARGEFPVEIVILFPEKSARAVTEAVTKPYASRMKELPNLTQLTVGEVSNILAQSVVGHMADEFQLSIVLTVPRVLEGTKAGVLGESLEHYDGRVDTLMLSHVDMYSENLAAEASMIVIANSDALHDRLKALDLA